MQVKFEEDFTNENQSVGYIGQTIHAVGKNNFEEHPLSDGY